MEHGRRSLVPIIPEFIFRQWADDLYREKMNSMHAKSFAPIKRLAVATTELERLQNYFVVNVDDGDTNHRIVLEDLSIDLPPEQFTFRMIVWYRFMYTLEKVFPRHSLAETIMECLAYYRIKNEAIQSLKQKPQRILLHEIILNLVPPGSELSTLQKAQIAKRLYQEANVVRPVKMKACRAKVDRFIDKIKREEI